MSTALLPQELHQHFEPVEWVSEQKKRGPKISTLLLALSDPVQTMVLNRLRLENENHLHTQEQQTAWAHTQSLIKSME